MRYLHLGYSEMYVGPHIKCPLLLPSDLSTFDEYIQNLVTLPTYEIHGSHLAVF
jgi:hypothetical protein